MNPEDKNMNKKVVIIGGGASGIMAAITAAREGCKVTILEHKDRVGKKILMTGNGKCNLTNSSDITGKYYGNDVKRIYKIVNSYPASQTIDFFKGIGLYTKEKRDGGMYPVSEQATSVLDALRTECRHLGINILTDCDVTRVIPENGIIEYTEYIRAVSDTQNNTGKNKKSGKVKVADIICKENGKIKYDSLVIAAGSKAAPVSGSDGSGYRLAKELGHTVIEPLPALVQLKCEGDYFKSIAGVRAQAEISLIIDNECMAKQEGELQLTEYGISGIPVFQFSRIAARAIYEKRKCFAEINFMTYMSEKQTKEFINDCKQLEYKTIEELLGGLVHKKIAVLVCKIMNLKTDTHVAELSKKIIAECINMLQHFKVKVTEANSFDNAQVCSGGIPLSEIDDTMQSKIHSGIYFAGEILDCDGICGGYNLQWAWSTGAIAGKGASRQ